MAEYNVRIKVKNDLDYDTLHPETEGKITKFNNSGTNLSSTEVESAIKEINNKADTNKNNINVIKNKTLNTLSEVELNKNKGFYVDALAIKELTDKIKNQNTFSSQEYDTGQKWIDGKKIYSKVISTNRAIPSGNIAIEILTGLDVSKIDEMWVDFGNSFIRTLKGNIMLPLNNSFYDGIPTGFEVWWNSSAIRLKANGGWNENWQKVITIKYTKK